MTPGDDLLPLDFALADVGKVAAEVVGVVCCGLAVPEDVIVAMMDGLPAMVDELMVSLLIGTGS